MSKAQTTTLLASAARTTSSAGDAVYGLGDAHSAVLLLDVTADESTAADTLDVYVQTSIDGTTWDDLAHFTQRLGNAGASKLIAHWSRQPTPESEMHAVSDAAIAAGVVQGPCGNVWRVKWVVVDDSGSASFTFSVTAQIVR